MARTIWRWTKRCIAGFCLLAAIIAAGGALFVLAERHSFAELNRTHEQVLPVDPKNLVLASAHRLLGALRPPPSQDSLQFVVMPSFGQRWFAVSLAQTSQQGAGEAIVVTPDGRQVARYTFALPANELDRFFARWDALSDGYSGEGRMLTDGNPLAFERRRGDRVTSAEGNSPCQYDVLADLAAQRLSVFVPELHDLRNIQLANVLQSDFCRRSVF